MAKTRYFSVYNDFKTSLFSKFFFTISGIFIIVVIVIHLISYLSPDSSTEGIIGYIISLANSSFMDISYALIILFAGLGVIALFFHHQFKKLAAIADDIEKNNQE